jgi:single-strand DNA-binding protein
MATRSLNRVQLIGHLGTDAELGYTESGTPFINFPVATNHERPDPKRGWDDPKDVTTWHNLVMFGDQAEAVADYLTTGKRVYVEGRLDKSEYTDDEGITRYGMEVRVARSDTLLLLDGSASGSEPGGTGDPDQSETSEEVFEPDDELPF